MNARFIRIKKECRALVWPWCAVMIAGALALVLPEWYFIYGKVREDLAFVGLFVGVSLLASLSLGNEFQHRTLSLLLSQPSGRMQIWGEKLIVTFVAVASAALVSGYALLSGEDLLLKVSAIVWVITTMASATFWTLVARSTIGGLALNYVLQPISLGFIVNQTLDLGLERSPALIPFLLAFGLCYAALMLWLGGRKLARFQVTGGMAGDDLLMAGPSVMPEALAGWFRCRPGAPFLNLIRKELRLLRPLWLITLLAVPYLACLAMFRLLPDPTNPAQPVPRDGGFNTAMAIIGFLMMPILAGSLSMGEERTLGTQSWNLTLPVSARRQWLLKLGMVVVAGLVCSVLLPLLVLIGCGSIFGSPFMFVGFGPGWLLSVLLLSFASFWCACAVNGTVRAAFWVFPVMIAISLAIAGGDWLGRELTRTTGTLRDFVVSSFHLSPLAFSITLEYGELLWLFLWLIVPVLFFAVIQSYRLFRTQPQDSILGMMRCLQPLVIVSLLCGLCGTVAFAGSRWEPVAEILGALEKLQPGTTKLELTGDDLAKGSPLSAPTRRWLRDSKITVAPAPALSGYVATIHLAGGLDCRLNVLHYRKDGRLDLPAQGGERAFGWQVPICVSKGP